MRARARGGLTAAAAFLEHAALLTPEPARRAQRELSAAWMKRDAGALELSLELLVAVDAGPPDALREAEAEHLRGQIAFDQQRGTDAARLLLNAARRLEPLDADRAREVYLEALLAAMWASDGPSSVVDAAQAARTAPSACVPPRAVDLVLDALATRFTEGYVAAAQRQHRQPHDELVRPRARAQAERRPERVTLGLRQALDPIEERRAQLVQPGVGQLPLGLDPGRAGDPAP